MKINTIGSDGKHYVWIKKGEPISDRITLPTVKFGGGNIIIWGCMGMNGVGMLTEVQKRMDAVCRNYGPAYSPKYGRFMDSSGEGHFLARQ